MAVEEKQNKKNGGVWSNPFSGRYEPFVDEKGFGKFHLAYLNTSKQINLDSSTSHSTEPVSLVTSSHTVPSHMTASAEDMVVRSTDNNHNDTVEQDQAILKRILADAPINMDHVGLTGQQQPRSSHSPLTIQRKLTEPLSKKPTEPLSPYLRFSQKLLGDLKKACAVGDENYMAVTENSLQASWKSLEENERGLYQTEYESEKLAYYQQMEEYKRQGKIAERCEDKPGTLKNQPHAQAESETVDPNDPLASLIKHINHLKQQSRAIEGDLMTSEASPHLTEPCPNVNPFPLASLPSPSLASFLQTNDTSESQKLILQQRLLDRIKNTGPVSGAVTTLTNSSYISPIPAVRMEPSPKTNLQIKDVGNVGGLDSDNVRLLKLLIPNFNHAAGGAAPPNYTAVPVSKARSPQPPSVSYTSNPPVVQQQQQQKTKQSTVVMDNEKCLEMFQNIKKQISDQAVFSLTATIHETSNESEGLILVVTRNKIDIHPQFGPIHVARVVITNKLYYKFFVLDKVVDSGQVGCKEISEVFWKLSEVSQHLLCPGFNQRYISKVEQTLGEKVEDITTSYCRLTAKLCTVWHQKDSKPGQYRNYHTRDLCSECLDLYHRLQFKTYSHTKLKQGVQHNTSKREQEHQTPAQAAKKPKLNGQFNGAPMNVSPNLTLVPGAPINDQQLKAVLSNLVANSRVVQVNKDSDGDDLVDILGEDSPPQTIQPTPQASQLSTLPSNMLTSNPPLLTSQISTTLVSLPSISPPLACSTSANFTRTNNQTTGNFTTSSANVFTTPSANIFSSSSVFNSSAAMDVSSVAGAAAAGSAAAAAGSTPNVVISQSSVPPNIRVVPTTNTQPTFMLANGSVVQQSNEDASASSKINEILASLNELQKNVPDLVGTDSVDEGIRHLLKQFQSSTMFPAQDTSPTERSETLTEEDQPSPGRLAEEDSESEVVGPDEGSSACDQDFLVIQED